jgi:hypothetical protein
MWSFEFRVFVNTDRKGSPRVAVFCGGEGLEGEPGLAGELGGGGGGKPR